MSPARDAPTALTHSVAHYENFPVATWLCPARIRPAVAALYAFARMADDWADEGDHPLAVRLHALASLREQLWRRCTPDLPPAQAGDWPVLGPLAQAVVQHGLTVQWLDDLLSAFEQDLRVPRYADRPELLNYCRLSANPVGRLLLQLYGVNDAASQAQSDAICTALQLINFWQDVAIDGPRGRLYIPLADAQAHGLDVTATLNAQFTPELPQVLAELGAWSRALMHRGQALLPTVRAHAGWRAALELAMVIQGGLRIVDRLEQHAWNPIDHRPKLRGGDVPGMLLRAFFTLASTKDSSNHAT